MTVEMLIVLVILVIAAMRAGVHGGAILVAVLPAVLIMAFHGEIPQPLGFVALFIAGLLAFYSVREILGGGPR
ncbi:hypothetical protein [Pyrococcus kukulkanii]|uniref:hypothetical protein n=1 Tax=Pyrococcus kukulkanii TaxID=1609559 RepID=UPI00356832B9